MLNIKKFIEGITQNDTLENQCFELGYCDGYFDENAYKEEVYSYEGMDSYYLKGYEQGLTTGHITRCTNKQGWNTVKRSAIMGLATKDAFSKIAKRKISSEFRTLYETKYDESSKVADTYREDEGQVRLRK